MFHETYASLCIPTQILRFPSRFYTQGVVDSWCCDSSYRLIPTMPKYMQIFGIRITTLILKKRIFHYARARESVVCVCV